MTFSLKLLIPEINVFSEDIMAKADNLSFNMVARKNVLILFSVEKHLSASELVIGAVINILSNLTVFGNDDCKLVSIKVCNKLMRLYFLDNKISVLVYSTANSVFKASFSRQGYALTAFLR